MFYSAVAAALIAQANEINEPYIKICLSILLAIGVLIVEFYEAHFRYRMKEYRDILVGVYKYFGHPFREIRIGAKGQKTNMPDDFEKVFKHGGCAYILIVSFLAINELWPKDYRLEYGSIIWPVLVFFSGVIIGAIILPSVMHRFIEGQQLKNLQLAEINERGSESEKG